MSGTRGRRGAAAQQYAIIVGLIAVVALLAIARMGGGITVLMTRAGNIIGDAGNGIAPTVSGSTGQTQQTQPSTVVTCKTLLAGGTTTSGVYSIDPDGTGGDPAYSTFCDMTTDGGGWSLAGYSYTAVNGFSTSNKAMYGLACGGGSFAPTARSGNSAAVKATTLAKASTEVAFGIAGTVASGPILNHTYASKFTIPNPSAITFDDSGYKNNPNQGACALVTVTGLKGDTGTATRYTFTNTLSASWVDSFPTGYGAAESSSCIQYHYYGPFISNAYSGSGENYSQYTGQQHNDCGANKGYYTHTYYGTRSMSANILTGDNSIWFR